MGGYGHRPARPYSCYKFTYTLSAQVYVNDKPPRPPKNPHQTHEKPMTKTLLASLTAALLLTACARGDTTAAVGSHNLSKGTCTAIRADGHEYKEEMTQSNCQMVGGKFTPRNRKKIIWF